VKRLAVVATASVLLPIVVAACGLGNDGELQTINQQDLLGLDETTTSTTTTTTPPTSIPLIPASTAAGTSTTVAAENVELFFVDGDRLQPVTLGLAGMATPSRVIQALLTYRLGGEASVGLRTLLPRGLVNPNGVVAPGTGEVTVDLATEAFNRIDNADQRLAIGQIVMTLVRRPGVGQVHFTIDGIPLRVPRRDGAQSEAGEGVYLLDYESLLDTSESTTTLQPTTVAPTTPPVSPPAT
jgi:hypothetical protein